MTTAATTTVTPASDPASHCGPMPGHPGPVSMMAALPHGAHPCYAYAAPPHPIVAVGGAPPVSAPSPSPAPALLPYQPIQHNGVPMPPMPHMPMPMPMPHMPMHPTYSPSAHTASAPQFHPGAVPVAMVPMPMVPMPMVPVLAPHPPRYPHHMAIPHPLMPAAGPPATVAAPRGPCTAMTAHPPAMVPGVVATGCGPMSVARPPLAPWEAEPGVVDLRLLLLKSRDMRRRLRLFRRHATRPPHRRNHNECVKARRGAEFAAQLAAMDDAARLCGMLPPTTEEILQHAELFTAQGFRTLPRCRPRTTALSDASATGAVTDSGHQRVLMDERFEHHVSDCDANSSIQDDAADDDGEPSTTAVSAALSSKTASGQHTPARPNETADLHALSELADDDDNATGHCGDAAVAPSHAETGMWSAPEMRSLFLTRVAFAHHPIPTSSSNVPHCDGVVHHGSSSSTSSLWAAEVQSQLPFEAARNCETAREQYRNGDDGVLSGAATTREAVHAALYRKFVLSAAHHCKFPAH